LTRSIVALVLVFACLVLAAPSVLAQQIGPSFKNHVPFTRVGYFYGRTGTAIGPSGYVEINPFRWLGFCAFASRSQATAEIDGGRVQAWDRSTGACATTHFPEMKGFLISPFIQITHQNYHNRISIPLEDGTSYEDGESRPHHLLTVGSSIDRAIVRNGPRWVVRIGRNFGDGPAAKNAGGLYVVGGVIFPLDHPAELGRSFRRMVGWKPPTTDSAAVRP
jgi:hypothetical protein